MMNLSTYNLDLVIYKRRDESLINQDGIIQNDQSDASGARTFGQWTK